MWSLCHVFLCRNPPRSPKSKYLPNPSHSPVWQVWIFNCFWWLLCNQSQGAEACSRYLSSWRSISPFLFSSICWRFILTWSMELRKLLQGQRSLLAFQALRALSSLRALRWVDWDQSRWLADFHRLHLFLLPCLFPHWHLSEQDLDNHQIEIQFIYLHLLRPASFSRQFL